MRDVVVIHLREGELGPGSSGSSSDGKKVIC